MRSTGQPAGAAICSTAAACSEGLVVMCALSCALCSKTGGWLSCAVYMHSMGSYCNRGVLDWAGVCVAAANAGKHYAMDTHTSSSSAVYTTLMFLPIGWASCTLFAHFIDDGNELLRQVGASDISDLLLCRSSA